MSSPFSLFRRHQRILMVVTTGLAMISFVLLGAMTDPRDMPMPLVILFLAAMVGGMFWLAGLSRGKGADWGLTGVIVGVALGLVMVWSQRESAAVTFEGGKLTEMELRQLYDQRRIANQFVQQAAFAAVDDNMDEDERRSASMQAEMRARQNMFGFLPMDRLQEDVVLGKLLRQEADRMAMQISDDAVFKFINEVSDTKLSGDQFGEIRRELGVSETQLVEILRQEIRARQAAMLLVGNKVLTPEDRWELYQQLNATVQAELVAIPVSSFVTEQMQPTDEELQELLLQYAQNSPGFTPDGQEEEGRPGFFQPPKFSIAYLEAVFDDIMTTVGEVTDEEIQQRYEEEYLRTVPDENMQTGDDAIAPPELPAPPTKDAATPKTDSGETATEDSPGDAAPADETSPPADTPQPEQPENSQSGEATDSESAADSDPQPDTDTDTDTDTDSSSEGEPTDEQAADQRQSRRGSPVGELQFVTFQETPQQSDEANSDAADASTPNDSNEANEQPASEVPEPANAAQESPEQTSATETDNQPAAEPADDATQPSAKTPPAGDQPETQKPGTSQPDASLPPPPSSDVPELDDALKADLRDDILRERTQEKIELLMNEAYEFVGELARRYRRGELEDDYISLEEASAKIQAYAEENHLEYIETPLMTLNELQSSEDYPIGNAFITPIQPPSPQTTIDVLGQSVPNVLFNVRRATRFGGAAGQSQYVWWKTGFQKAYAPKSIDDEEAVREQVVETWKRLQADEAAKNRAEALAKLVRDSEQSMAEALADETVTGEEGALFLTVRETGEFTARTRGMANPSNPFQVSPPRYSVVPGAEDAGKRFFDTVFDELSAGEVGVAPNRTGTAYYVIRIKDKNPSTPEQLNEMRQQFLAQQGQMQNPFMGDGMTYRMLEQELLSQYSSDWTRRLFEEYDVKFFETSPESGAVEPNES